MSRFFSRTCARWFSDASQAKRMTIDGLRAMYVSGQKIRAITAYDCPTATIVERAGVDIVLIGDSLGMTVLGYDSTVPVTLNDMVHHCRAVVSICLPFSRTFN
jgi:3-methyl-2-oxobutanoate hydroxymethyltransferase